MIAITLRQVQAIGTIVSVAFGALSIASAWLMKTVAKKVMLAVVFAALALVVWTQRGQVQSCANDVKSNALRSDTTCTFFGADVKIPTGAGG